MQRNHYKWVNRWRRTNRWKIALQRFVAFDSIERVQTSTVAKCQPVDVNLFIKREERGGRDKVSIQLLSAPSFRPQVNNTIQLPQRISAESISKTWLANWQVKGHLRHSTLLIISPFMILHLRKIKKFYIRDNSREK